MGPTGDQRPPLVIVALGGNAIQHPDGDDSVGSDFERTAATAAKLVQLAISGPCRLVVTHGNGPQVGNHLLRSELGKEYGGLPLLPLDVCVADTQGGMGYMIQQSLANAFHEAGVPAVVVSVVSQVVVAADDPAFEDPSKPVGEMIPAEEVADKRRHGWTLAEDKARGAFRRVVASPDPVEIVEAGAIKALVDEGVVVVAAGGGGVPVIEGPDGSLEGCAAVVDKDLASALLASDLHADGFVILTDVKKVYRDYGTGSQRSIDEMSLPETESLLANGQFPAGSMGPKVEAMRRFVAATRRSGVIASIDEAERALDGSTGTRIVP